MKQQVCAGGFLMKENKFLFGKRATNKSWAPGVWDIAGGHSKKNELPLDTLKREMFEEIGITVLNAEFISLENVPDESRQGFFKYHIYLITEWTGEPVNCSPEHTELRWFTSDELSKVEIALPGYLQLIDAILSTNK